MGGAQRMRLAADLLGVARVPAEGRGRLIATAIELFYRHGFNAVGLDRVLAEAGVSKTTFYKHFDSKIDLLVEAIHWRDQWEQRAWERAVRKLAGDDPRRQLRAFFEVLDVWFTDPQFNGCIFMNAAAEFPDPNDPVHRAAADHKRANYRMVRELAVRAGAMEPDAFADAFMTLCEGTLIMRQVYGRDDAARKALPTVDALIEQYIPAMAAE